MKNSSKLIILLVLTFFFYTFISNPDITSVIFIASITLCMTYGIIRKESNLSHISCFIMLLYSVEYITIDIYYTAIIDVFIQKTTIALFYYGYQMLFAFSAFIIFIFRVQISRVISDSKKIKLTPFDNIIPWIYIYNFIVTLLHTIDYYLDERYQIKSLSFAYYFYEELLYFGMSMIITTLVSMVIYHEKEKIKVINFT